MENYEESQHSKSSFYLKAIIDYYYQSTQIKKNKKELYESFKNVYPLSKAESKLCEELEVTNKDISRKIIEVERKNKDLVWRATVSYSQPNNKQDYTFFWNKKNIKNIFLEPSDRDSCAAFRKFGCNRFLKVKLERCAESGGIGNELIIDDGLDFGGRRFKFLNDWTIDAKKAKRKSKKDRSYEPIGSSMEAGVETREAWFFAESDNDFLKVISVAQVRGSTC